MCPKHEREITEYGCEGCNSEVKCEKCGWQDQIEEAGMHMADDGVYCPSCGESIL